ncbi:hypothetical protein [Flavobacterium sp. HSC-61S13]|uniref:hypothetical protein n=1 Tax=Flavobacterium sp. HSC-61S13 TaxID=2910963 RepID=UPI0020A218CA|nr:hypothetical protein [Flavobacterium sp. HSC-61S13]MCP1995693.1 hypothetical protein [Flavobacterium sp. HSC-61S13]
MKNSYKFLVLFTLLCSAVFAQERILIDGRAKVYKSEPQVIYLKNINSGKQTQSDLTGYFSILVQKGDVLSFWANNIKMENVTVTDEIIQSKQLELMLLKNDQLLEEIIIDSKGKQVDPLGFKMKTYSKAERIYRSESYFPLSFTSLGLGPLINVFNGKRKMQRKMLDYEKDDINFQYFKKFYPKEYLVKRFHIPEEYTDAFSYFVIEQPGYDILNWSNREEKDLELAELAVRFKELHKIK